MLCWYSSCSKDSFDSLRHEHWKSFSVYHWEVGLFGWGLFWGYCYLQRLQARSVLWLFFCPFLWGSCDWSCSDFVLCGNAVATVECHCAKTQVGNVWGQCNIQMDAVSKWHPHECQDPGFFTLLPVIGFMDIRCGRFYYGMVWRFHLDWIIPFSICKQSKSLSH